MSNDIRIIRAPHDAENPYFLHHRGTAQDRALSWEARGVMSYLLSKPQDWEMQLSDLEQNCGRDKAYSIVEELIEARYLKRVQPKQNGRFGKVIYYVYERPYPDDKPLPALPETVSPYTENPDHTYNRESQNTDRTEESITPDGVMAGTPGGDPPAPPPLEQKQSISPAPKPWELMSDAQQARVMFQAICDAFGYDAKSLTKSKRGQINAAEKELRGVHVIPDQVPLIYAYCGRKLDHFGPNALATQYNDWLAESESGTAHDGYDPTPSFHEATEPIPTTDDMMDKAARIRELFAQGKQDEAIRYTYKDLYRERAEREQRQHAA